HRLPSQKIMTGAVFAEARREQRQFSCSSGCGASCEVAWCGDVSCDSDNDSSVAGSDTLYFSLAQLPRSVRRQRSLQKGKSLSLVESVGFRQMGQCHSMGVGLD